MRLPTLMADENVNPSDKDLEPIPDDPHDPMMPPAKKNPTEKVLRVNSGNLDEGIPNHTDSSKRGFDPK